MSAQVFMYNRVLIFNWQNKVKKYLLNMQVSSMLKSKTY